MRKVLSNLMTVIVNGSQEKKKKREIVHVRLSWNVKAKICRINFHPEEGFAYRNKKTSKVSK